MSAQVVTTYTLDEYYALDDAALDVRYEYIAGSVFAMAGATRRRNLLAGAIYRLVAPRAEAEGCRPYMEGVRIQVALTETTSVYYPDVMVSCGEPADDAYETSACLLVEVLSPSTESIDRREKLSAYRSLPDLRAYLLVHQDEPRIEVHHRGDDGRWLTTIYGVDGVIDLRCPLVMLSVREVYVMTGVLPN